MTDAIKNVAALVSAIKYKAEIAYNSPGQLIGPVVLHYDMVQDIIATLQGVADGTHVVVPKKPIWELLIAGRDAIIDDDQYVDGLLSDFISTDDAEQCYRAMINATETSQ